MSRRAADFAMITLASLSAAYARAALSPLQEALRSSLHLEDSQIALMQGPALAIPFVLATLPLGLAIDRYSRARLLLLFTLLQAGGSVITALAPDFATLFAARCVIGFTTTAIGTTVLSLLADLWAENHRGRASMVIVVGQFAGMALAFQLGGVLLSRPPPLGGWRGAMEWLSAPLLLVAVAMLLLREPPRTGVVLEHPSGPQTWRELWQYRFTIAPLMLGIVTAQMSVAAVLTWTAPAITRSYPVSMARVGSLISLGLVLSGVVGPVGGGFLADFSQTRRGPKHTLKLLSGVSLVCVPAGLFAIAGSMGAVSVLFILFISLVTAICVIGSAAFTIVVPNEIRGISMAILASVSTLCGDGLAPVMVNALARQLGGEVSLAQALSAVCAVVSLAGAVFFASASPAASRVRSTL